MSANLQANGDYWNNANGISVSTQQLLLIGAHVRLDDLGAIVGAINIGTSVTDGRVGSIFQVHVLTTGRPRLRVDSGGSQTVFDMTTGTALTANTWGLVAAVAGPFDGTSRTTRLYLNGTSEDDTFTLPTYSGSWVSCAIGDGNSAESDHRVAYAFAYSVADLAAADTLITSLLTTQPGSVGSPVLDFPFESAAPAGFSAVSGAAIDAAENPSLSGGGGGGSSSSPIVIVI